MGVEPNAYRSQEGRFFIVVTCLPTPFPTSSNIHEILSTVKLSGVRVWK